MNLSEVSAQYLAAVEAEMRDILTTSDSAVAGHYGMMQYHMGWVDARFSPEAGPTGKRVRPLLCLLSCAAAGGDPQRALPAAAGLELLHNFSLIHDDIEDRSPTRRHRPTAWTIWGMPLACNAGDGMFSLAHLAFHRLLGRGVAGETVLAALRAFGETCVALTEGQYLDMSFEGRLDVTPDDYFRMIAGKTGALLAAAPQIGALIAEAAPHVVSAYRRYGALLGRAFQLQDDILGIWGDESVTGKSAASDILSKKMSLPVVYALEHPTIGTELKRLYGGPAFTESDVPRVLALLDAAGVRARVEAQVRDATEQAHAALISVAADSVPAPHRYLGEILDGLVGRAA